MVTDGGVGTVPSTLEPGKCGSKQLLALRKVTLVLALAMALALAGGGLYRCLACTAACSWAVWRVLLLGLSAARREYCSPVNPYT